MLSFQAVTSSAQAAHYFESADDYYEKEGHRGEWLGEGAEELGLTGQAQVDRESFKNILDGKLPNGKVVRFADLRSDDRKGMDYTFSAPKSVSLQALVAGDEGVTAAHDAAVKRAVRELELLAQARIKEKGQSYRVQTGNIVAAAFRHELSRAQDPQLHTHVIVANVTKRPDGEWRALSNEDIQRNIKSLGSFYRAALAEELRARGYELRETQNGFWELSHVSDELIKHYSTRAKEIEAAFEARGLDRSTATTAQAQALTLMTRHKKTEVDRSALRQEWIDSAKAAGLSVDSLNVAKSQSTGPDLEGLRNRPENAQQARASIDFAIEHLSERQGIFSSKDLQEVTFGKGSTKSTVSALKAEIKAAEQDGRLVRELPLYQTARSLSQNAPTKPGARAGADTSNPFMEGAETERLTRTSWVGVLMHARGMSEADAKDYVEKAIAKGALVQIDVRYTTPQLQAVERKILGIEQTGRGAVKPVMDADKMKAVLGKSDLNEGQKEAVQMILGTSNRFVGVQGYAGTGKSHMLNKAIDGITGATASASKEQGFNVIGLAPYATQVQALKELGVESNTLASFLASRNAQGKLNEKSVVILDEAGVVPAYQLAKIMSLVEKSGARMVMVGDRKQTGAVEAGKPFSQLQDAGMVQAQLREIRRQKDPELKAAVINAAGDKTNLAVDRLHDRTQQVPDARERHDRIAQEFFKLSAGERDKTLIVSGTNEARREINDLVREKLGLKGGREFESLEKVDATRAQLKEAMTYGKGDLVVHYHRAGQNVKRGELYDVQGVSGDNVTLKARSNGEVISVNPKQHFAATIERKVSIEIAPGDMLRITKNNKDLGLLNGDRVKVLKVSPKEVTVQAAGRAPVSLATDKPLNVQHGYATTVHSAQGLTANRVLIDADTRSITTNRAVFYVAISRPKYDLKLFTDNQAALKSAVARIPKKFAALELRTPYTEKIVVNQKHNQIGVKRIKALTTALQKSSGNPTTIQPNHSVAFGRKSR